MLRVRVSPTKIIRLRLLYNFIDATQISKIEEDRNRILHKFLRSTRKVLDSASTNPNPCFGARPYCNFFLEGYKLSFGDFFWGVRRALALEIESRVGWQGGG